MSESPRKRAEKSLTKRRGVRRRRKKRAKRKRKERVRHGSKDPPLQRTARFRKRALQKLENLGGEFCFVRGEEMGGDFAKVPDEAAPGEGFERVVGDVDFPPEEALASASHVMVMIVVPAFAEGQKGEKPVVAAGVGGLIAARAEKMRER